MTKELLLIEDWEKTENDQKIDEFINGLSKLEHTVYNIKDPSDFSLCDPRGYNDVFSEDEVAKICEYFNPLPIIHEESPRIALFSYLSSPRVDKNLTKTIKAGISVHGYGISYFFHFINYLDYDVTLKEVGFRGINESEKMIGTPEEIGKSDMLFYLCDLLISRYSQTGLRSV